MGRYAAHIRQRLITRLPESKNLIVLLNNTGGTKLGEMSQNIAGILFGKPFKPPVRDIAETLFDTVVEKDVQAAIKQYRELKTTQKDAYDFSEPQLNGLGYRLMQMKRVKDAIEIFKLNVEMFPQGFNTYDSLADAYSENGDKQLAIQNYKKSLKLNPNFTPTLEKLKKLEAHCSHVAGMYPKNVIEDIPAHVLRQIREEIGNG